MSTPEVGLIHWKEEEAAERIQRLRQQGLRASHLPIGNASSLREIAADPPDAIVIDLERLPSHGRDVGVALRQRAGTREIPLIFVGGHREKRAAVRKLLPDAAYCEWAGVGDAVRRAIASRPESPVVPSSAMAGYSGRPLPVKLGLKAGMTVGLIGAPDGFSDLLRPLPGPITFRTRPRSACDMTIWFVSSLNGLKKRIERIASLTGRGGLWIAWPKKASGTATDITQNEVRRAGLASGLVDFKICAIDATWSALRFAKRNRDL